MVQLTVGYVAGFIAAALFVVRLLCPSTVTFIMSGILGDRNSAATWTVASHSFQKSQWPTILQTDNSYNHGVRRDVLTLTRIGSFMVALIAIAGVITPLGLYEVLEPTTAIQTPFHYVKDQSSFGYGTPSRSELPFNRICNTAYIDFELSEPIPCPFSDTVTVISYFANGSISYDYPYGYDIDIPQKVVNTYSSGTDENTTVSGFFDIQWRQYATVSNNGFNNGSAYLVGSYRSMQVLILSSGFQIVEGLIVDTINGGIGLRNHTVPSGFQHGATWTEDILFIQPETVCVDTNLTLDYGVSMSPNSTSTTTGLVLTDRGGFVNLNRTYPTDMPDLSDPQANADLHGRAYKAAWLNNAYTALFYNVTDELPNETNSTSRIPAWSYVDSSVGKTFPISSSSSLQTLQIDPNFGDYLDLSDDTTNGAYPPSESGPANPFNINGTDFDNIMPECIALYYLDFANITNIYVACGTMHGVPQRKSPGSNLVFDGGSTWSQPLYTCASAVKATVKTVSFNYNGTGTLLQGLTVTDIQDKVYQDESSMPLWGVENTGDRYTETELSLIWGLVSSAYETNENVSTVRQESLYLPGFQLYEGEVQLSLNTENLPGSDFYMPATATAYNVYNGKAGFAVVDYSGTVNMAMWALWQNLSFSSESAAMIPNLIWTDNAASAVVGTKGVLGPGNTAGENIVMILVSPTVLAIKYHYLFGIPAFLAGFGLVLIIIGAFATLLFGHRGISQMRRHLQQVSPGRIFTTFLYLPHGGMIIASKEWSARMGSMMVDISGEFPKAAEVEAEVLPPTKVVDGAVENKSSSSQDIVPK